MSKKVPFTEEQLRVLELNPYTYSASSNRITFTLEFKKNSLLIRFEITEKQPLKSLKQLVMIRLGLHKDAKAVCADVFLKKQILSKDFVLHEAFIQNNSLLHSRQKIFLPKKQMPVSKNYRNGLFI